LRRAAIFDLDGTLIPRSSAEWRFFIHLLRKGGLTFFDLTHMVTTLFTAKGNLHEMTRANKRYLRGKPVAIIEDVARNYFEPKVEPLVFPVMRAVIEAHREVGDLLLLLTGTLDVIAACFVRRLRFDGYRATALETKNGKYTGLVNGFMPYGMGKLEILRNMRHEFKYDQNKTSFYADSYSDRYVMNAAEEAIAVNPDKALRSYARKHGWRIIDARQGLTKTISALRR